MSELALLLLRFGFLLLLWAFVFAVVYALRSDLFGQRVRRMPQESRPAPSPVFPTARPAASPPSPVMATLQPRSSVPATTSTAHRLVITSGAKAGIELPLGTEPLTIGRSSESSVVIRDEYTSTHHARLLLWDDEWVLQDLDSTNGTFLDGARVTLPTKVPLNAPIKIGATSFELRR